MRLLDLLEAPAAIFSRVIPWVWRRANEAAIEDAIAEINPVVGDDFVNNRRQLSPGATAFELQTVLGPVEVVGDRLKNADEDHVDGARLLQIYQPRKHLACVQ